MTLYEDNQLVITLTRDHQYHTCTKHIDIHFHFICWIIAEGKIKLVYCPTEDMIADNLTKALPSPKVKHFAMVWKGRLTQPSSLHFWGFSAKVPSG